MTVLMESFNKFNYCIRPSKQVERKLFIEIIHSLSQYASLHLKEYTYLGMGSIYYADFILFHKYLYIDDMICIEGDKIKDRMIFNKPYKFITLEMGRVSDVLPKIKFKKKKYLVWLDYESELDQEALADIDIICKKLEPGSIIIITVCVEPILRSVKAFKELSQTEKEEMLCVHYTKCAEYLTSLNYKSRDIARNELPNIVMNILNKRIMQSTALRSDSVEFVQLFNYTYADGAQMLSYGGFIDKPSTIELLRRTQFFTHKEIIQGRTPRKITVPPLTIKEKQLLDCKIERSIVLKDVFRKLPFKLDSSMVKNYIEYYRHYPTYHETIM